MFSSRRFHASAWLTAAGALLFLFVMELAKPGCFFWDDNVTEFWPGYALNLAALRHGVLPQIDFFNYLGQPSLSTAQSSTFYPPVYLAATLAEWLHRPDVAIAWLDWIHLAAVALVVERFAREMGGSAAQAVIAGWLYLTLPIICCMPQLWVHSGYTAFYVPLIFLQLELLIRQVTFRRIFVLALAKAFFFFSGAINFFALSLLFEAIYLAVRWATEKEAPRRVVEGIRPVRAWIGATVLALLLALPSLGPIAQHIAETADRAHGMTMGKVLDQSIQLGTFFCAQAGVFLRDSSPNDYIYRPGWLFLGGSILVPFLILHGWRKAEVRRWGVMALAGLLLSTPVFAVVHFLPGYGSFRWPAKDMLFAGFFFVLMLVALIRALPANWPSRSRLGLLLVALTTNIVVALGPESSNGAERFPRYPAEFHLPMERLREGRAVLVGLSQGNRFNPDFLGFQFATLAHLPALAGYDPLVFAQNKREALNIEFIGLPWTPVDDAMVEHFAGWSVRYYFVDQLSPVLGFLQQRPRFRPLFQKDGLRVLEDTQAQPLAYFEDAPQQKLPVTWGVNDVVIDTSLHPGPGMLSLSLVPLAGYSWSIPGGKKETVPVAPSGRMRIPNVTGGGAVQVRYDEPRLMIFIAISLATLLLAVGGLIVEDRQRRRSSARG